MASNVKVTGTDARLLTIKVNPGTTYLQEVLDQACKKWGVPSDKYLLKHQQRQLDLSNTVKTAGLIPGANLEMVVRSKSPSVLSIALQLPEPESTAHGSSRAILKLPSDFTIWKVLRQFESVAFKGKGINITGRGVPQTTNGGQGQLYYETPVLGIERRSFSTFLEFQKTLSQLGYNSGTVLIRLSFQKTDQTLVDAMDNIRTYFHDEEEVQKAGASAEVSNPEKAPTSAPELPQADGTSSEATKEALDVHPEPSKKVKTVLDAMDVDSSPARDPLEPVSLFLAPSSSTPAAANIVEPNDVYEPGIAHAQLHQQRLKTAGQNKRLKSDQELAEEVASRAARLSAINTIDVKVRFPDNTTGTWTFGADDAGETLYAAVRRVMAADSAPFKLVMPLSAPSATSTRIIRDDGSRLIQTYNLTVRTVVNFFWDETVTNDVRRQPFLKQSASKQARDIVVPAVIEAPEDESGPSNAPQRTDDSRREGVSGSMKKMPKWLKGLSKK